MERPPKFGYLAKRWQTPSSPNLIYDEKGGGLIKVNFGLLK